MNRPLALIVDDEPDIRELLEITLGRMGVDCIPAADLASARRHLKATPHFDLCLTDMRLPDGSGLELVEETGSELPIAVITAHGNMETAIQALKAGAFDFVSKPIDLGVLRQLVQTVLKLSASSPAPHPATNGTGTSARLLGNSASIQKIRIMIGKLARSQAPAHITGESGTGKELVARLIHEQGPRRDHPFIAINCGAIPSELMESEFFGHRKGSFTGAVADKEGLFQAAGGGTLFLDEVADLPLHMQVKLLRAIQERSVRPVGGQQEIPVDVRIISATHKNLAQMVQEELFRQDLFYRLNVIELEMPPLRKRREDIPALIDVLLKRVAAKNGMDKPAIEPSAFRLIEEYPFPGNVRELENVLERAVALCDSGIIQADDLHLPLTERPALDEEPECPEGLSLEEYLEKIERRMVLDALEATRWNRTAAAKRLGISFRALRYRLEKLGLDQGQE
ncbi:MAG: sigma-54-dependent Fis family transcriptional regulator [Gammaproteobacteria bacterium RIFOXYA12_FULL_61_12]|nr:MAG: sigma-54-dependent Fis family transcriptional regulator [Gammaproteobacteria bacterium RIFOXYD12_FULL_61_37]OGT93206.1 MAG: sigma-54-dependent Fis family transcriptional regulator [Gammaproteobacteria bacterium RIFOXYA12_FULL_61_12]